MSENDLVFKHEYDGIKEYDNPMPRWWLATFWVTIIFSVLYLLNVPLLGKGKGRIADYDAEMAAAAALAAQNDPLAGVTDASLAAAAADLVLSEEEQIRLTTVAGAFFGRS